MIRRKRLLVVNGCLAAVVLVLAVGAYVLLFRPGKEADAGGQRTVEVQRGTVTASVSASGTVDPAKSANVDFGTSGTVEKVDVGAGDTVEAGDVLARLDDTAARQALTAARTKLTAAQQSYDELDDQDVCDDDTTTGCVKQSQLTQAQAEVDAAEANVSSAEHDLDATKLRAPMAGKVVAVNGTVGSSATGSGSGGGSDGGSGSDSGSGGSGSGSGSGSDSGSGGGSLDTSTGFVVIAGNGTLVVDASFAEADVAKLKKSQQATVTFPALPDAESKGRVASIDPAPDSSSGVVRYDVRVTIPKPPKGLRLGQTAQLSVVTDHADDVLYVPTTAVTGSGSQATVTVLANGEQETRSVTTGLRGDSVTEVTSGLKEGEQVVLATATTTTNQNGGGPNIRVGGGGGGGGGGKPGRVVAP